MRTDLFDYELPPDLIAQEPAPVRDEARLLVVHRDTGRMEHRQIHHLPEYLNPTDALVLNDTRVIPARLLGVKGGSGGRVELLLLEASHDHEWEVLMRCSRRPPVDSRLYFGGGRLQAVVLAYGEQGHARVRLESADSIGIDDLLEDIGVPPLPPYITRKEVTPERQASDRERYQTIYAREPGAVAAPTAGLHFTPDLLARIDAAGVARVAVTLHVGIGTFRPVSTDSVEAHVMEEERYQLTDAAAQVLRATRARGGRIVAVGSTTVRTLETIVQEKDDLIAAEGRSSIFIYPPYTFRAVDVMMTNFHLPRSTLLMMVCALGGRELMMEAYRVAVQERYRFYSYGDAMLIL